MFLIDNSFLKSKYIYCLVVRLNGIKILYKIALFFLFLDLIILVLDL